MSPDLYRRRDLAHLIHAENAIDGARTAVSRLITEVGDDLLSPLFTTLQEQLIIDYGRAFNEMRPFGRLDANTQWGVFVEPKRQGIHDKLLKYRNQSIAHTQFKADSIIVNPPHAIRSDGNNQGEFWGIEPVTVWLTPADMPAIKNHLDALAGAMMGTIMALLGQMYGAAAVPTASFPLISQAEVEQLEEELKEAKKAAKIAAKARRDANS